MQLDFSHKEELVTTASAIVDVAAVRTSLFLALPPSCFAFFATPCQAAGVVAGSCAGNVICRVSADTVTLVVKQR
jgi:hypothetical protein